MLQTSNHFNLVENLGILLYKRRKSKGLTKKSFDDLSVEIIKYIVSE